MMRERTSVTASGLIQGLNYARSGFGFTFAWRLRARFGVRLPITLMMRSALG